MFRTLAPRRRAAASALVGAVLGTLALGAAAAPAHAQSAVTLDFNSLQVTDGSGIRYVDNCYQESGFVITAVGVGCGTAGSFATASADDPVLWTGSPSLFFNDPTATVVSLASVSGSPFSMQSIDFAPFLGAGGDVMLTGFLTGGGTVTQTCTVAAGSPFASPALSTCSLGSAFVGLSSVQLAGMNAFGEPIVEFDNVALTATPEPTTVALFAAGLLGLGAAARRRRQARA
ncbi:MAG TPA: PEP-CTERM sorting domain-containing protein [Gemmatirosa sp.]